MTFSRRYITALVGPPALVTLPLAFLFISQVIQLSLGPALAVIALLLALAGATAAALFAGVTPLAQNVETAVGQRRDVSNAVSECLRRTSLKISELAYFADSLYVSSVKNKDQTTANTEPRISLEPPLSAIESNLPLPVTVPHDRAS